MPRWEYVTINVVNSYGMQYRANGEKQHQWKDKQIFEVFKDLGKSGYELTVFDGENYIFKRQMLNKTTSNLGKSSETTTPS